MEKMKNEARILLRLPLEDKKKLDDLAWNNGRSTSKELRLIIMQYLESYEGRNGPIVARNRREPEDRD